MPTKQEAKKKKITFAAAESWLRCGSTDGCSCCCTTCAALRALQIGGLAQTLMRLLRELHSERCHRMYSCTLKFFLQL